MEVVNTGESFFELLGTFFESHQISSWFRVLKQGFFVHEDAIDPLILAYQEWTKRSSPSGEGRSIEKCRKRLLGTEELPLLYALDGNRCLPGILLAEENVDARKAKIPLYQANLQPAKDYLHPRDPFLAKLSNPKSKVSTHQGFILEYLVQDKRIEVSEFALRDFAQLVRVNPRIKRTHSELNKALRYVVPVLSDFLQGMNFVSDVKQSLVPGLLKDKPKVSFATNKGYNFAFDEQQRLITCFSNKGKALPHFVKSEVQLMTKSGSMRGFIPELSKKHCLGKTFSQNISFYLSSKALLQFMRQVPRIKKPNVKRLPAVYSVRDVIERFAELFRNSRPLDERELIGKFRKRESFAKYRRNGNWIFIVVDRNVISSCVYTRSI